MSQDFPLISGPDETKRRERGSTAVIERPAPPDPATPHGCASLAEGGPSGEPVVLLPADSALVEPAPESEVLTIVRRHEGNGHPSDPAGLLRDLQHQIRAVEALVQAHGRLLRERDGARLEIATLEEQLAGTRGGNAEADGLRARVEALEAALKAERELREESERRIAAALDVLGPRA